MNQSPLVQQAYQAILKHFIAHGNPPHFTELAQQLDLGVEEARTLVRETAAAAPVARCWLSHDTDYIIPINDWAQVFSGPLFRNRLDDDYLSNADDYLKEYHNALRQVGKTSPFWQYPMITKMDIIKFTLPDRWELHSLRRGCAQ